MTYMDGSKFTAQTLDGHGKPLVNQNVTFNVMVDCTLKLLVMMELLH